MENKNILEINEAEFEEKVLKASSESLVLVDFWAPWCGPCKQLTPILEKIINNSKDKVRLVKVNIDESQQISSQLRIQSIPAVFAFKDGQPVDAFQGVIPEKKIIEFIEKSLGEKLIEDFTEFYKKISDLILINKFEEAKNILEDFLAEHPNEFRSFAMYIDCLSNLDQFSDADNFVESLDELALADQFIKSSLQKLSIKKKNKEGPSLDILISDFQKNPNDIKKIMALSDKYFAENKIDEAFNLLFDNFKKNNDKVKSKFLEFFAALGNTNPKTIEYRKKLSSVIFS